MEKIVFSSRSVSPSLSLSSIQCSDSFALPHSFLISLYTFIAIAIVGVRLGSNETDNRKKSNNSLFYFIHFFFFFRSLVLISCFLFRLSHLRRHRLQLPNFSFDIPIYFFLSFGLLFGFWWIKISPTCTRATSVPTEPPTRCKRTECECVEKLKRKKQKPARRNSWAFAADTHRDTNSVYFSIYFFLHF